MTTSNTTIKKQKLPVGRIKIGKGGLIDFCVAASADNTLMQAFLDVYYQDGVTPQMLLDFFMKARFFDVSLADCTKALAVLNNAGGQLPCNFNVAY